MVLTLVEGIVHARESALGSSVVPYLVYAVRVTYLFGQCKKIGVWDLLFMIFGMFDLCLFVFRNSESLCFF